MIDKKKTTTTTTKENKKRDAEDELIINNISLVHYVVREIYHIPSSHPDYDDIIAIGSIGLIKAARTYTPSRNANFSTYAVHSIKQSIYNDYFLKIKRAQETMFKYTGHVSALSLDNECRALNNDKTYLEVIPYPDSSLSPTPAQELVSFLLSRRTSIPYFAETYLRYALDYSFVEIASLYNKPVSTIRSRTQRGLSIMRKLSQDFLNANLQ